MLGQSLRAEAGNAGGFPLRIPAWRWALGVAASLAVGVVLWLTLDWTEFASAFRLAGAEPLVILGMAAAYSAAFWLRAAAWRACLQTAVPLRQLFSNLQVSLFLNHLLPLKAGEVSRPLLARLHGMPAAEAVSSTLVTRLLDFVCLALIAVVAVPAVREGGVIGGAVQLAILGIACAVVALVALRFGVPGWLPAIIRAPAVLVHDGMRAITGRSVMVAAPLALGSWLLEASVLLGTAHLFGAELSLQAAAGATAFTILFQVVHVTPGGIGVYEAAMTSVLVSHGLPAEQALSLAVMTHAMKFAYSFSVGAVFAASEGVFVLRGKRGHRPKSASTFEVVAARLWNVVNEGKPFTPVFTLSMLLLLSIPHAGDASYWGRAGLAMLALLPLAVVFFRYDFPLKLRAALPVFLLLFVLGARFFDLAAAALVVACYLGFTIVLWGTIYYHLRIGTAWTNGIRFTRLVFENPDPTSGNLQEQLPKVLLLVLAFHWLVGGVSFEAVAAFELFVGGVAVSALLLHQWFFTWVPALPGPRAFAEPQQPPVRATRKFIAIVIDGCRADRLLETNTPVIDRLRREGTDFPVVNTVYPARTVTCFSSMLTGAPPSVHGMHSNFVPNLGIKCESLFDTLRAGGLRGKMVGIAHLIDAFGEQDVHSVTAVMHNDEIDDALVARGKQCLLEEDPDLLVLQLLSVDQTGHARGSYNAEYLRKIEETDAKIGEFLEWCRIHGYLEDATVLITSDHGQGIGIGGHGHMSPPEIRIPCILWGEGVPAGEVRSEPRFVTDIAPTIAAFLGVEVPAQSVGRPLLDARPVERPVVFVVPAKNEAANLPGVLAAIRESNVGDSRVVVVDDGSTDDTAAIARSLGATVISHATNRGLGAALRSGLSVARGMDPRAVVYLDADLEYDARETARLLEPIERGEADYVLGTRTMGREGRMRISRRVANRAFSLATSLLCGRWIADGQTGFRAFSPRAADVAEIIHDYNYAQVLTLDLLHKGMRMRQVPVSYRRRKRGESFISPRYLWRVPLGMMREVLAG